MRTKALQFIRWSAVILFGGCGLRILISEVVLWFCQPQGHWDDYIVITIFLTLFFTLFSAPFLWVAYICFREQYHRLITFFAAIGAVVVCGTLFYLPGRLGTLIYLPGRLGIQEFLSLHDDDHLCLWLDIIQLLVCLLRLLVCLLRLFGPFYAAAWFFRYCHRLAARYLYDATPKARNA